MSQSETWKRLPLQHSAMPAASGQAGGPKCIDFIGANNYNSNLIGRKPPDEIYMQVLGVTDGQDL